MTEQSRKTSVRLELTQRQKKKIRQATGREVSRLELRLEPLPEPTEPLILEKERTDAGHAGSDPASQTNTRRRGR